MNKIFEKNVGAIANATMAYVTTVNLPLDKESGDEFMRIVNECIFSCIKELFRKKDGKEFNAFTDEIPQEYIKAALIKMFYTYVDAVSNVIK